jgi:hypothetical protein
MLPSLVGSSDASDTDDDGISDLDDRVTSYSSS